jgi:hypothetical protein
MLKELKFVSGSLGKAKFDSALSHFIIKNGRVKAFNGVVAMSCPIPTALDVQPDAAQLTKAVGLCKDEGVELTVTPAGKLRVRSGAYKVFVNCYNTPIPNPEPEGIATPIDGKALIETLKIMAPFMGTDSNHAWNNGVYFKGESVFSSNNVILVEAKAGTVFPTPANVPSVAVKELLRIGEHPTHVQLSTRSVTFHYEGQRWLRTQLREQGFPEGIPEMFKKRPLTLQSVPGALWASLDALSPFVDDLKRIFIKGGIASTHLGSDTGASYAVGDLPDCAFNIDMLKLVRPVATRIDFNEYPKPGYFQGMKDGVRIRGLITPIRGL